MLPFFVKVGTSSAARGCMSGSGGAKLASSVLEVGALFVLRDVCKVRSSFASAGHDANTRRTGKDAPSTVIMGSICLSMS
jgi:hypothetical protein